MTVFSYCLVLDNFALKIQGDDLNLTTLRAVGSGKT